MSIQRYDPGYGELVRMDGFNDGQWVLYAEHKSHCEKLVQLCQDAIFDLTSGGQEDHARIIESKLNQLIK